MTSKRRQMMADSGKLPKQPKQLEQPPPKQSAKSPFLMREDHLSKMNDDCLRDVLARVDYNDLDEFGLLSKRMNRLCDIARPKAIKLEADNLQLIQKGDSYLFTLLYKNTEYSLSLSNACDPLAKMRPYSHDFPVLTRSEQSPLTNSEMIKILSRISSKFVVHRCKFKLKALKIYIPLITQVISTRSESEVSLEIDQENLAVHERKSIAAFVDDNFLQDYVQKASCMPCLIANMREHDPFDEDQSDEADDDEDDDSDQDPELVGTPWRSRVTFPGRPGHAHAIRHTFTIRDDREFVNAVFPMFRTLEVQHMIVKTQLVLEPLLERLRLGKKGMWRFRVATHLDGATVQRAANAAGMTYSGSNGKHNILFRKSTPFGSKDVSVDVRFSSFDSVLTAQFY